MLKLTPAYPSYPFIYAKHKLLFCLFLLYAVIAIIGWDNYFLWSSPLSVTGLISLPLLYSSYNKEISDTSTRYFIPAILFIVLTFILPVKTFLYFSIVLSFLFLVESLFLKCGSLPLFLFVIISPIFNYFTTVFTFPIRLQLSNLATKILAYINPSVQQSGNVIRVNNTDFSVDAECMGLNMVNMGLLTGVLLLGHYQRKTKSIVSFYETIIFLIIIFTLIIISNLFRIVCLVQFNISPDTWMHEITGLGCFIIYLILPATYLVKWMVNRRYRLPVTKMHSSNVLSKWVFTKNLALCAALIVCTTHVRSLKGIPTNVKSITAPIIPGFQAEIVDKSIIKLENSNSLIYIKPINGFYSTEHSPMICWKGSGYDLKKIQQENISEKQVYTAELFKDKETLYTCWWFDNGGFQTIDQLNWRWKVLRGENDFSIVNITANSKAQLLVQATEILKSNWLREILTKR